MRHIWHHHFTCQVGVQHHHDQIHILNDENKDE